ncbi:NAD(P)-dependent oxidoreductase [Sphingomonas sp.]|uniref:NAD(P)-dependent oxidoreductase n=1 Tax=Sphingomonas sp. TaxID=28214 RepID=UPI003CC50D6D
MTWPGLPILVKVAGRPVILLGAGEAAAAKRRLLKRAGALIVEDHPEARLGIVAIEDEGEAKAAAARLRARGVLVNVVDRPFLCDFTLPAIVDRAPVLVAVATGGASAGLAAALRQRLEDLLPARLGALAAGLFARRAAVRARLPDPADRRRALADAFRPGGRLDPLLPPLSGDEEGYEEQLDRWVADPMRPAAGLEAVVAISSADPDQLTVWQTRVLANADRVFHHPAVPAAILDRARADAVRIAAPMPQQDGQSTGIRVYLDWIAPAAWAGDDE